MPRQLTFDLPAVESRARGDFFISPSNRAAYDAMTGWRDWHRGKLVLAGPVGSGKTHLAHIWAEETDGSVILASTLDNRSLDRLAERPLAVENAERAAGNIETERTLFHLHNLMAEHGQPLLVTARTPPANWGLTLPDLDSRMQGTRLVTLDPPDDALLSAVLVKLFADRQVEVTPALIGYLVRRMERTLDGAARLTDRLDRAALAEGRALTRDFAAKVLDETDAV